jgi:hypothetical protein
MLCIRDQWEPSVSWSLHVPGLSRFQHRGINGARLSESWWVCYLLPRDLFCHQPNGALMKVSGPKLRNQRFFSQSKRAGTSSTYKTL